MGHDRQHTSPARKLLAIMFTDIVGFTTMMGSNEDQALEMLHENREIHKRFIERHGGKWLKEMGDGILAQFSSALDSVNCALDIQKAIQAGLDYKLRIGIHLGDVTVENGDIFGDGVNIASRIQSIADPGGIYISESIHEAIRARNEIHTEFLGEIQLKNVNHLVKTYYLRGDKLPIPSISKKKELLKFGQKSLFRSIIFYFATAFILVVLSLTGWWIINQNAQIQSLAVLPVVNLSGDSSKEILLAGIHQGIRDEIAKISTLRVPSRTSTFKYQDGAKSIPEIARELNVDVVVETDLYETGDSIRMRVRLIKAFPEERQLWSNTFYKATQNVLSIYDDIALAIARETNINLTSEEITRFTNARQVNPEAYEAYLTGMGHLYKLTRQGIDKALQYFNLSLEKDPDYAPAYMGIAFVWGARMQQGFVPFILAEPNLKLASSKAIDLDSTLIEIHYKLAIFNTWCFWKWEDAEKEFIRTLDMEPNHAEARAYYAHYLNIMQRSNEAIPQIDKALKLQPYNALLQSIYGMHLNHTRQYDKAVVVLRNTLEEDPDNVTALSTLWTIYHNKGMYEEALDVAKILYAIKGENRTVEILTIGYEEGGYKLAMERVAEAFILKKDTTYVTPWQIATLYTRAEIKDKALVWLERAYEEHDVNMPYISADPIFDDLRNYPRFQDLLKKMNLPQ